MTASPFIDPQASNVIAASYRRETVQGNCCGFFDAMSYPTSSWYSRTFALVNVKSNTCLDLLEGISTHFFELHRASLLWSCDTDLESAGRRSFRRCYSTRIAVRPEQSRTQVGARDGRRRRSTEVDPLEYADRKYKTVLLTEQRTECANSKV